MQVDVEQAKRKPISALTSEERIAIWRAETTAKTATRKTDTGNGADGDNSLISLTSQPTTARTLVQWPDALGKAAYYGLVGEIVNAIGPHTEADPVAVLGQLLAMSGNVIGRGAHFVAEADRHYTNSNIVLVGNTSKGRKGTSYGQVLRLMAAVDEDWARLCVVGGLSSGEGLIWAVRDQIEKHEPIKEKGHVVGYQDVITDQGITDKRLLVAESEFASVLKVANRECNTLSAIIRQAWDSGNLNSLTKNSPARATGAHISIIGHITRDELRRYLDATEMANGFANRFLWFCVRQSKMLPEGGQLDTVDFGPIQRKLKTATDHGKEVKEMKRDENARALWWKVYPELSVGKAGLLGAVTSRAEAQVMRLACLYALLDCSATIRKPHLEAALEVWRYAADSARFIFGDAMGDPTADAILGALREAGEAGMTRTQISDLLKRHANRAQIDRSLESLAEAGRAGFRKEQTDGRPIERWFTFNIRSEISEISEISPPEGDLNSLNSLFSQSTKVTTAKNVPGNAGTPDDYKAPWDNDEPLR